MKRQKGQSLVEFALVIPFFFAMCFAMIYGGIMFLDYLQFNNSARVVAREISIMTSSSERDKLAEDFESNPSEYVNSQIKLYTVSPDVDVSASDVTVEINLTLNEEGLPVILNWLNFPPKTLRPVKIVMPLESAQ